MEHTHQHEPAPNEQPQLPLITPTESAAGGPISSSIVPFNQFYTRVFALCTALLLSVACYRIVEPFMGPLLWALSFAFLLHPLHVRLTRRLRNRPTASATLLTLGMLVALVGPLAALGASFVNQASALLQHVQSLVAGETQNNDMQFLTNHPKLQGTWQWLEGNLGLTVTQVRGWLSEATHTALQAFASSGGKLFLGALGTVVGLVLTLFLMFFFIRDGASMLATTVELIPMAPVKRRALFTHLATVMRAVMFGTALSAAAHGVLVAVGFLIVGLPSPIVFGTLAGLLGLLPVGGTAFVWVPAALVLAAQERWVAAIFMFLWGALLVSTIDNVLKPLLISGRAPVATLTVLLGVLGGVAAFGAVGLFVGPMVLALVIALIHFALDAHRENAQAHSSAPTV